MLKNKQSNQPFFSKVEILEIHLIEIPKFEIKNLSTSSRLSKWMTFFKAQNDQILEDLKMSDSTFEHAVSELEYAKMKPEDRTIYNAHLSHLSDRISELSHAESKGIEIGKLGTLKRIATKKFGPLAPQLQLAIENLNSEYADEMIDNILDIAELAEFEKALKNLKKA